MGWFSKKKKEPKQDLFVGARNYLVFKDALFLSDEKQITDSSLDKSYISIDPSTFESNRAAKRWELYDSQQLALNAIREINRFDALDLADITFYHDREMNEYTFYETVLEKRIAQMTGLISDAPVIPETERERMSPKKRKEILVNDLYLTISTHLPESGHLAAGEYARALKIMKYQTPEEERYKPKIKMTKPKAELKLIENTSAGAIPKATAKTKFCTQCGATLTPNAKFCTSCGSPIK